MARPIGQEKLGGRQKGTPNKMTKDLREMILCALDEAGGKDYLVVQAHAEPKAFLQLIGKVVPKEIKQDISLTKAPEGLDAFYSELTNDK